MIAKHKEEAAALERNLESEKSRQQNILAQKIAERKRLKEEELEKKRNLTIAKELLKQQDERNDITDEMMKSTEKKLLSENAQGKEAEAVENMVSSVLQQRHLQQTVQLADQLDRERDMEIQSAGESERKKRLEQRETLIKTMEQELIDLVTSEGTSLTDSDLQERRKELKRSHDNKLKEYDGNTSRIMEKLRHERAKQLEVKQTYDKLALKERQLQEIMEAMDALTPEGKLAKKYAEEARKAMEEAKKYQQDTLMKMQSQLEKDKAEKARLAEQRKAEQERAFKEMEAKLEAELREEQARELERQKNFEKMQKEQLMEREKRREKEINERNLTEDEKEKLLREHQENKNKLEESLKKESERSASALQKKLEEKRQKRKAAQKMKMEKEHVDNADLEQVQQAEQIEPIPGGLSEQPKSPPLELESSDLTDSKKKPVAGAALAGPMNEQEIVDMLMKSPLFKQITDLHDLLEKTQLIPSHHVAGADYSNEYIDVKDAQWLCSGDLKRCDANDLTTSQFVVYRFGVFLIELLKETYKTPEVALLLASNIPKNNFKKNAYRNSFFFERASNTLFVRKERLDSVGEFSLLLVHCMAHVSLDELTDDSAPMFLRKFYHGLKTVCQDMFFSRSFTSVSPVSSTAGQSLPAVFSKTLNPTQKFKAVQDLMDLKHKTTFPQAQKSKDLQYQLYSTNAALRQAVASRGGLSSQREFVDQRLDELQGPLAKASPKKLKPRSLPQSPAHQPALGSKAVHRLNEKKDAAESELATLIGQLHDLKQNQTEPAKGHAVSIKAKIDSLQQEVGHIEQELTKLSV